MRPPFSGSPGEGSQHFLTEQPGASDLGSARLSSCPNQCIFCTHVNPAGAKFCNDCGSPLHLKPCRQCDAINDRAARRCYKCGIEDPVLEPAPEAVPKVVVRDDTVAAAAPDDVGIEPSPAMQSLWVVERDDEVSLNEASPTAMAGESDAAIAAPQLSMANPDVVPASSEIGPEGRAAERPPRSRLAMAGLLSAAAVAAVAVYAYRADLLQPSESMRAAPAPAVAPTEPTPAKVDVPVAAQPPATALSTSASPLPQDGIRASAPVSVDEPALTSIPSSPAVPPQAQPAVNEPLPSVTLATQAPTVPPIATTEASDSRAAPPPPVAKKSATNAKTTAKKAKKPATKKAASTPATSATKPATTTELPKSAE